MWHALYVVLSAFLVARPAFFAVLFFAVHDSCCCRRLYFFQAEDGIRDLVRSRGLGDVYKRQDNINGSCHGPDDHWRDTGIYSWSETTLGEHDGGRGDTVFVDYVDGMVLVDIKFLIPKGFH